jgi:hypothetical protein
VCRARAYSKYSRLRQSRGAVFLQPRENPPHVGIRAARATGGAARTSRRVIDMAKRFYYEPTSAEVATFEL